MDDRQTSEELFAHYGPDGPVQAVFSWLEFVESNDDGAVWVALDADLRLALAQDWACTAWIYGPTAEAKTKAESIATEGPASAEWTTFQAEYLERFKERFSELHGARVGAASGRRVIPPDFEVVLLLETSADVTVLDEATPVMARAFLVRSVSGSWRIANFHDRGPVRPGWPPEFG